VQEQQADQAQSTVQHRQPVHQEVQLTKETVPLIQQGTALLTREVLHKAEAVP
jgi:hypothetical protein